MNISDIYNIFDNVSLMDKSFELYEYSDIKKIHYRIIMDNEKFSNAYTPNGYKIKEINFPLSELNVEFIGHYIVLNDLMDILGLIYNESENTINLKIVINKVKIYLDIPPYTSIYPINNQSFLPIRNIKDYDIQIGVSNINDITKILFYGIDFYGTKYQNFNINKSYVTTIDRIYVFSNGLAEMLYLEYLSNLVDNKDYVCINRSKNIKIII